MDTRPKTIICDIDGTLVKHQLPWKNTSSSQKLELLPGTIEKFSEWDAKGYNIILMTGRKESLRFNTEKQLSDIGIFYDKLIFFKSIYVPKVVFFHCKKNKYVGHQDLRGTFF